MVGSRDGSRTEPAQVVGTTRRKNLRQKSLRFASGAEERVAAAERAQELELQLERPKVRADCSDGLRPCPYVGCRYHLYLDVTPGTGTIRLSFPELEVWEMQHSCALDVADQSGISAEHVSVLMNISRERVRQIEAAALSKLERRREVRVLADPA
ncbi:MAG TPA: hypothetical protein VFQ61_33525 [Polyangiaceae bacterium]|nr:hypothetical protein [Polyangiaceae bacterium]